VIIGDKNVGKTCFIKRYKNGAFSNEEETTLGA